MAARVVLCLAVGLAVFAASASAFQFDVAASAYKCLTEELPSETHVLGQFKALPGYSQFIDVRVTTQTGDIVQEFKGQDKGDFNFVTGPGGDFIFCFYNRMVTGVKYTPGLKRRVEFSLQTGKEAIDYKQVARKEHLKPVEINLRIMEDTVRQIHTEYTYFKQREAEMRDTNEAINAKSLWTTLVNIGFFAIFATWQVIYLKKFFVSKKLING